MRKRHLALSALCVTLLAGTNLPAIADGTMTISIDPLYLHRDTNNVPLTLEDIAPGVLPNAGTLLVMNANDADFGWGGGLNLALMKDMGSYAWQGGLMYVRHSNSAEVPGCIPDCYYAYFHPVDGPPDPVIDSDPYTWAWKQAVENESTLLGVEFNRVTRAGEDMQWLVGARVLSLQEQLDFTSWDNPPSNPNPNVNGYMNIETRNTLVGVQGGVKGTRSIDAKWRVTGLAKAGVYLNHQKKSLDNRSVSDSPPPDFTTYSHEDSDTRLAGVVEAGVNLDWLISKTTTLSLGYTAMYLAGVSNAVDQMPIAHTVAEFTKYDDSGSVLYHGVRLGLAIKF